MDLSSIQVCEQFPFCPMLQYWLSYSEGRSNDIFKREIRRQMIPVHSSRNTHPCGRFLYLVRTGDCTSSFVFCATHLDINFVILVRFISTTKVFINISFLLICDLCLYRKIFVMKNYFDDHLAQMNMIMQID